VYERINEESVEYEIDQQVQSTILPSSLVTDPKTLLPSYSFSLRCYVKLLIACSLLFLIVSFGKLIYNDFQLAILSKLRERQVALSVCIENYSLNDCSNPLDKIKSLCDKWFNCMQTDPNQFERSTLAAELLGRIIASFLTAMSARDLLTMSILVFLGLIVSTVSRVLYRCTI